MGRGFVPVRNRPQDEQAGEENEQDAEEPPQLCITNKNKATMKAKINGNWLVDAEFLDSADKDYTWFHFPIGDERTNLGELLEAVSEGTILKVIKGSRSWMVMVKSELIEWED